MAESSTFPYIKMTMQMSENWRFLSKCGRLHLCLKYGSLKDNTGGLASTEGTSRLCWEGFHEPVYFQPGMKE